MKWAKVAAIGAVLGVLLGFGVLPCMLDGVQAAQLRCEKGGEVTINTERLEDVHLICSAAEKAKAFLGNCNLEANVPISIIVNSDSSAEFEHYGSFDPSKNVISLASRDAVAARLSDDKNRRGVDPTEYYWSVVVHEVMHRLSTYVTRDKPIPRVSHEYLAYAAHFDALSEASKEFLLKRYSRHKRSVMPDDFLLLMDPVAFAAVSYFHFQEAGDRCATIRRVLSGELQFERHYE